MSEVRKSYNIGNVGDGAVTQHSEYLIYINIEELNIKSTDGAEAFLHNLQTAHSRSYYKGPLQRRLELLVLVNRVRCLQEISHFFEDAKANVLFIVAFGGMGKSTLVRGALEFRRSDTAVVWVTCEGLATNKLLNEINAGLELKLQALVDDEKKPLSQKFAAILGAITRPSIIILDEFDLLLDANNRYRSQEISDLITMFVNLVSYVEMSGISYC